ncbi:unnamed protein product [Urochloa humidicola]
MLLSNHVAVLKEIETKKLNYGGFFSNSIMTFQHNSFSQKSESVRQRLLDGLNRDSTTKGVATSIHLAAGACLVP